MERANATPYGLAAYVFTRILTRAIRVSEALEYGIVGVNDGIPSTAQHRSGGSRRAVWVGKAAATVSKSFWKSSIFRWEESAENRKPGSVPPAFHLLFSILHGWNSSLGCRSFPRLSFAIQKGWVCPRRLKATMSLPNAFLTVPVAAFASSRVCW
jgi:hypothetical protein